MHHRFHFSVGSFPERIEKGNFMFVFFEQQKVLNTHRLLAVKYYTRIFLPSHWTTVWYTFLRAALPFQRGG